MLTKAATTRTSIKKHHLYYCNYSSDLQNHTREYLFSGWFGWRDQGFDGFFCFF